MDLTKIIGELRHEKERLDRVIAAVEETASGRGRAAEETSRQEIHVGRRASGSLGEDEEVLGGRACQGFGQKQMTETAFLGITSFAITRAPLPSAPAAAPKSFPPSGPRGCLASRSCVGNIQSPR